MLVVLLKKTDYKTKITEIENKLNNHNHDKYIITPEFDNLADVLMQDYREQTWCPKQLLIKRYQALIEKLLKIKQKQVYYE